MSKPLLSLLAFLPRSRRVTAIRGEQNFGQPNPMYTVLEEASQLTDTVSSHNRKQLDATLG